MPDRATSPTLALLEPTLLYATAFAAPLRLPVESLCHRASRQVRAREAAEIELEARCAGRIMPRRTQPNGHAVVGRAHRPTKSSPRATTSRTPRFLAGQAPRAHSPGAPVGCSDRLIGRGRAPDLAHPARLVVAHRLPPPNTYTYAANTAGSGTSIDAPGRSVQSCTAIGVRVSITARWPSTSPAITLSSWFALGHRRSARNTRAGAASQERILSWRSSLVKPAFLAKTFVSKSFADSINS
jgi:hypothetical protein